MDANFKNDICKTMLQLRKESGFTQQKVADYLGIDRSNYSKYELGKLEISIEILVKLARLYDVSADYILNLSDY